MTGLQGKRVLLTRGREDNAAWAERLRSAGAEPVGLPCLRTQDIRSPELIARCSGELPNADWLAFTSRRGVEAFARVCRRDLPARVKVAAVGPATAAAAQAAFGRVDLLGEAGTAASLAEALLTRGVLRSGVPRGETVLLAVAKNAGTTVEERLEAASVRCVRLNVYHTVPAAALAPKRPLSGLGADNVWLASPTAVTGFVNQVDLDIDANFYTIGPSTTAAAHAAALSVTAQAENPSLEGLMEAMR